MAFHVAVTGGELDGWPIAENVGQLPLVLWSRLRMKGLPVSERNLQS